MTLENKISKIRRHFRIYESKTVSRAVVLLDMFGDASEQEIREKIDSLINNKPLRPYAHLSDEELDRQLDDLLKSRGYTRAEKK